jgi:AcrR family transcriptional regulator
MRKKPQQTYEQIITAALTLAEKYHYMSVTAGMIAERAGCSKSLVRHHLGNDLDMRSRMLAAAVMRGRDEIIEQGIRAGELS